MRYFIVLLFSSALLSCLSNISDKAVLKIIVENPSDFKRIDEPVVISRSSLFKNNDQVDTSFLPFLTNEKGEIVPSQCDDTDLDGKWDELAFVSDLLPKEKIILNVSFVEVKKIPVYPQRAHARLGYSETRNDQFVTVKDHARPETHKPQSYPMLYQFEGPGWENDKIGFRLYFDSRNGKDIFGKSISKMMLDSIGLPGTNYHELQRWGMDILKVGSSLGAGSIAMVKNDSLYRLGETKSTRYQLIADGPVRAVIRITYTGWDVGEEVFDVQEDIAIWAGKYCYESTVSVKGNNGNDFFFATGIVNLKNENREATQSKSGKINILATHCVQSENNDFLGMAILADDKSFSGYGKAPEQGTNNAVTNTDYVKLKPDRNASVKYAFYAGWELSPEQFKTKNDFIKLIEAEALKRSSPVIFSVQKK